MNSNVLEEWAEQRRALVDLFYETRSIARELDQAFGGDGTDHRSAQLTQAMDSLSRASFRIMVFGDFSSGKSTLINALLGENLLPTKENPTTAFTTVLRWAEEARAELRRPDGRLDSVSVEEFTRQVELDLDDDEQDAARGHYDLGIVYWPFKLLERDIELIDSAGTNESATREKITLDFLPQVDAIVFVTPAKGAFTKHDQDHYLSMLRRLGHSDIFFVVNQFDLIRRERDREDVRRRCRGIAAKYTNRTDRIFFTSALEALDAVTDQELAASPEEARQMRARSGVPELHEALTRFCMAERSRIKILRPAEVLRREALELRRRSVDRRTMLSRTAADLQLALDQKQETRQSLQVTVARIETALDTWVKETERYVARAVENHIRTLLPCVENQWLADLPKKIPVRPFHRDPEKRWAAGVKQIDAALEQRFQRELYEFSASEEGLAGALRSRQEVLEHTLLPLLQDYQGKMEELRAALLGPDTVMETEKMQGRLGELTERLDLLTPSATTGIALGSMAGSGSILLATGGVAAGLVWTGLATATLAAPIALGLAGIGGPVVASRLARRRLRNNAAREYREELEKAAPKIASDYARSYGDALREQIKELGKELNRSLMEMIGDAERAIKELRSDRAERDQQWRQLANWEYSLTRIEQSVGELVEKVLGEMR